VSRAFALALIDMRMKVKFQFPGFKRGVSRENSISPIALTANFERDDQLKYVLNETEPAELKIVLGHMIEKIVVEDDHLKIYYTFRQSTIMPVAGDPCGI
jgi:hypothetical protein